MIRFLYMTSPGLFVCFFYFFLLLFLFLDFKDTLVEKLISMGRLSHSGPGTRSHYVK